MTLLPASVLVSLFVWRLPFGLSSKGGPASSYATAGIALRVTDVLKPPHHDKVETPMRRSKHVEAWNKLIIKFSASNKYIEMHGQQNIKTQFMFSDVSFAKTYRLWDNVEKYSRTEQATDDNMAHARYMPDT